MSTIVENWDLIPTIPFLHFRRVVLRTGIALMTRNERYVFGSHLGDAVNIPTIAANMKDP